MASVKQQKEFKPIYYIYSKEPVIISEAVERLKRRYFGDASEVNIHTIELRDNSSVANLLDAALTVPFISEKRLVIVKGIERLAKSSMKLLAPIFEGISSDRMIVFTGEADLKDAELKNHIKEKGEIYEYKVPTKKELPEFIRNRFKSLKLSVKRDVVELLIDTYGTNIATLLSEIEKIGIYSGPSVAVDVKEIERLLSKSSGNVNIFIFLDAVAERRVGLALGYLDELLRSGETTSSILYSIVNHFRTLLKARYCIDEGMRNGQIRSSLESGKRMPDFRFERIYRQSDNFSLLRLKYIYRELLMTEVSIKKEGENDRFALEKLIFKIGETRG